VVPPAIQWIGTPRSALSVDGAKKSSSTSTRCEPALADPGTASAATAAITPIAPVGNLRFMSA
jgi:hypothetical protein